MPIPALDSEQDLEPLLESNRDLLLAFFVEHSSGSPSIYATLPRPKSRGAKPSQTTTDCKSAVKLYVTNSCPWCRKLESYLDRHGVQYSKFDVSTDVAAARAMMRRSGQQGVPQAEIDGTMVVGFDKSRIDQLLGL
jgi:glutaredoxin-like YruB-family protein